MGIEKVPEKHLGSRQAQMEALGIATPRGVENEHQQWSHKIKSIDTARQHNTNSANHENRDLRSNLGDLSLSARERASIEFEIASLLHRRLHIVELTAIAEELGAIVARASSRAQKVIETCRRYLEADVSGSSTKAKVQNRSKYADRAQAAEDHLSGVLGYFHAEIAEEAALRRDAKFFQKRADEIRRKVDEQLTAVMERSRQCAEAAAINAKHTTTSQLATGEANGKLKLASQASEASSSHKPQPSALADEASRVTAPLARPARHEGTAHNVMGPLTAVHRKLDEIMLSGEPIIRIEVDGGIRFDLVEHSKRVLGENASGIHDPQVQHRFAKLHATQMREIARIKGYAQHKPQMIAIHEIGPEGPSFSLSSRSPPELVALAKKYATHPLALELVRRARWQSALADKSTDRVVDNGAGSKLGSFDGAPLSPPFQPPRTVALVKKADSEPRVDRLVDLRPAPHARDPLEVSRVEAARAPLPRGAEPTNPGSLSPVRSFTGASPKPLDRLPKVERILPVAAQQPRNAATLAGINEPRQLTPDDRAMSVEMRREYAGSTPPARGTEDVRGSELNGTKQDTTSPLAHTLMSREEREDFLRPRVLGNNRASVETQPKGGATSKASAWDHLSRLASDRDMVRLRQLYDQYEGAKAELEKDRFAYVINAAISVSRTDRSKLPALRKFFERSDRHKDRLEHMHRSQHFQRG